LTPSDESAITENDLTPSDDEDITEDDLTPSEKSMVSEESEEEPKAKVESEDESNDDDNEWECEDSDSETGNAYKKDNQVACSEADMINTLEDCIAAFNELKVSGFTWHKEYSHADQTPGCRWDSYHMNFAFNSNLDAVNKASP
jgi:hypothetical protein